VELYAEKVANRGLCAVAQAESLRYKLLGGLAVRRCGGGGIFGGPVRGRSRFWGGEGVAEGGPRRRKLLGGLAVRRCGGGGRAAGNGQ
jgi:hypothetical protein